MQVCFLAPCGFDCALMAALAAATSHFQGLNVFENLLGFIQEVSSKRFEKKRLEEPSWKGGFGFGRNAVSASVTANR